MAQHKWLWPLAAVLVCSVSVPSEAAKKKAPAAVVAPVAAFTVEGLIAKRNYKNAFTLLLGQAKGGDAKAMTKLANLYRLGLGTDRNLDEARKWYQSATNGGNAEAKRALARLDIAVPATVKKLALKSTSEPSADPSGIDFAGLPARAVGLPDWATIAAAHKDATALKALGSSATGEATLVSALLADDGAVADRPQPATDGLGRSALILAVAQGKRAVIDALLKTKPDLSIVDKNGFSATSVAALACDGNTLTQLVAAGAPLNSQQPAVVLAARSCEDWSSLKAVFEKQDLNLVDPLGRSAGWYAAEKGNVSLLGWLADNGADLAKADQNGVTSLHAAAQKGQGLAFRFLLNKSLKVNTGDKRGVTPLMLAASSGCMDCVKAALDTKPDLDAKDAGGDTALMYAVRGLQGSVVQLLSDSGANQDAKTLAGDTPKKLSLRLAGEPLKLQN